MLVVCCPLVVIECVSVACYLFVSCVGCVFDCILVVRCGLVSCLLVVCQLFVSCLLVAC